MEAEGDILEKLRKLYKPFESVLRNGELEKFINYSEYTKHDRRLTVESLLDHYKMLVNDTNERIQKISGRTRFVPITKLINSLRKSKR